MRKLILSLALFILTGNLFAQFPHPDTTYFFLFGNNGVDEFRDVCNDVRDSGYVAVGTSSSFSNGNSDVYLVKTDWKGNTLWSRSIGSSGIENGYAIEQTFDKGFIIAGFTNYTAGGDYDAMLIKTDSSGFVEWQKNFGGSDWDFAYAVSLAPDSGYVFCGETYSFGNLSSDVYLVRTDKNGNLLWEKNYGGQGKDVANKLVVAVDSAVIMTGYTESIGQGMRDLYLIKCNSNGDTLFTRTFGGAYNDEGYSIIEHNADFGYVMTGYTESFNVTHDKDIFLLKFDSAGNFMWQTNFGSSGDDAATCIYPENNYFFVSGYTANGAGVFDLAAGIVDAGGNWDWNQSASYGGFEADFAWANLRTLKGDYLFAGSTKSFNALTTDAMIILVDSVKPVSPQKITVSSDTLVGLSEIKEDNFGFFPNPASEYILIPNPAKEVLKYSIYNLSGNLIESGVIETAEIARINTSFLAGGTYVLQLNRGSDSFFKKLIIIR